MAPAAHRRHHHHREDAITITHNEHQGANDVTSMYEVVVPTTSVLLTLSSSKALLSLSPPSISTALIAVSSASISPSSYATIVSQPTTSDYPRPSSPTIFYPVPVVPPHVYKFNMQHDALGYGTRMPHRTFARRAHQDVSPMPTWLVIVTFVIITAAVAWTVLVCSIHWRGVTTGMTRRSKGAEEGKGWWVRKVGKMRPFGGAGRYTALRHDEDVDASVELRSNGSTSAHHAHALSPINPYLVPPDQLLHAPVGKAKARGSAEWAEQHRAFFSPTSHNSSASHPRASNSTHSISDAELQDVESEAREAQGRRLSHAGELEREGRSRKAGGSWIDVGLAVVDGAVDRFAAKIVRWADDNGGDEALVLPLAKGKQD